jgi:hypothetical protein
MCHHAWLIIDFKAITVTGYTEKGFYPLCGLPSFFSLVLPWNTMNRREPWCQCSLFGGLGGEAACDYRTLTGKLFSAFLVGGLGRGATSVSGGSGKSMGKSLLFSGASWETSFVWSLVCEYHLGNHITRNRPHIFELAYTVIHTHTHTHTHTRIWYWRLNSGPRAFWESVLPLEPCPKSFSFYIWFVEIGSC